MRGYVPREVRLDEVIRSIAHLPAHLLARLDRRSEVHATVDTRHGAVVHHLGPGRPGTENDGPRGRDARLLSRRSLQPGVPESEVVRPSLQPPPGLRVRRAEGSRARRV